MPLMRRYWTLGRPEGARGWCLCTVRGKWNCVVPPLLWDCTCWRL